MRWGSRLARSATGDRARRSGYSDRFPTSRAAKRATYFVGFGGIAANFKRLDELRGRKSNSSKRWHAASATKGSRLSRSDIASGSERSRFLVCAELGTQRVKFRQRGRRTRKRRPAPVRVTPRPDRPGSRRKSNCVPCLDSSSRNKTSGIDPRSRVSRCHDCWAARNLSSCSAVAWVRGEDCEFHADRFSRRRVPRQRASGREDTGRRFRAVRPQIRGGGSPA